MTAETKVVAFDCDGVMFDSREANRAYYNHLLDRFHLPEMTPEQLAYAHMHTVGEALAFLIPDSATLEAAHAYRKKLGYLPFLKYMQMEPGLVELLERLHPRYKTAVATNRTDTMAHVLVDNRIDHLFDLVVCALDVTFPKPHPEALNKVVDHFAVLPDEVIYVGDSQVDEMAARQAGIFFVAYRNPELKADRHIRQLSEIADLLDF
ncbi:haloacid dehalogenase [Desulfosarcina widdelii]|uniref:phosphoglycolate phosphatase n=1 Tax=Desulfosarcina widdelii TaxID=947919 RepID=A0A5K7ZAI1_9BACT|nr:HAD-IA family hydrolase [Desulfosarcina widdelii]BBO75464.1 haloacid dehalogenase [Desulfosarcina widdelii]